jgi:sugar phosphate isomerase/epimerase
MAEVRLGSQSYSFRQFDLDGAFECARKLGLDAMEFCTVHFPADPEQALLPDVIAKAAKAGVKMPSFGVEDFTADTAANLRKFQFAKALGVEILTANPTLDALDNLDKLTEQFGIKIAIHNHGPESHFSKVRATLDAIKGHSPMIGACVDTGHALRSHENPHEVIEQLGDRVVCMHLKDWIKGGDEQILGEGDMDLDAVVKAVKSIDFRGWAMLEYENSPENPIVDMKIGIENWRKAWNK